MRYLDEMHEIKALKSEMEMYKNYSYKLAEELEVKKKNANNTDKVINDFNKSFKELYDIQCKNFNNNLNIIKVFSFLK